MIYLQDPQELAEHDFTKIVLICGNYDGIHLGHRKIIATAQKEAKRLNAKTVLLSFQPHPRSLFTGEDLEQLDSIAIQKGILSSLGLDALIHLDFSHEVAQLSPLDFIEEVSVESVEICALVVGKDWRFAHQRQGTPQDFIKKYPSIEIHELDPISYEDEIVSSSRIRQSLKKNNFSLAKKLLARPFFLQGKVIHGQKIGRQLKSATANLATGINRHAIHGVFLAHIQIDQEESLHPAIINIGHAPTIKQENSELVECHLLDLTLDLYDHELTVFPLQKVRDEQKFPSLKELQEQIQKDLCDARAYFKKS